MKDKFTEIINNLKPILSEKLAELRNQPYYEWYFELTSYTTNVDFNTLLTFNEIVSDFISFKSQISDNKFQVSISLPINLFYSQKSSHEIYNIFSQMADDFAIGLSISTFGRFWWHSLSYSNRFLKKIDSRDLSEINIKLDTYNHPIGFDVNKNLVYISNDNLELFQLLLAILWGPVRKNKLWNTIYNNYRKALLLYTLPVCDYSFYEEIFLLFYKSIENIVTVDVLNQKKLKNEKSDIINALKSYPFSDEISSVVERIYINRSKIAAHNQNATHDFITFEDVNDSKLILDFIIQYDLYNYFLGNYDLSNIQASYLRSK